MAKANFEASQPETEINEEEITNDSDINAGLQEIENTEFETDNQ